VTDAGYIAAGYVIAFGSLVAYAIRTVVRGRALSKQVPEGKRRWL